MTRRFTPIPISPGLYRAGTRDLSTGRWYDGNGIRWFEGRTQPIGGWSPVLEIIDENNSTTAPLVLPGIARAMVSWIGDLGGQWIAIGTNRGLFIFTSGTLYDVTPAGFTPGELDSSTSGSGSGNYGDGNYGGGLYGLPSLGGDITPPSTWQLDTFGDWVVGVASHDGRLLLWDRDPDVDDPAEVVTGAPEDNAGVVVTPERFVVLLGAGGNVRLVQWASQETVDEWDPLAPNSTAGDLELVTNGKLLAGRRGRGETLLWTTTDLHSLVYIGGDLIYSAQRKGDGGLIAPNAVAMIDGSAFWMGPSGFFRYDGGAPVPIPCEVSDYVFSDLTFNERAKIVAIPNTTFGEVWWFYPSSGSLEPDRYVCYSYREGHWSFGELARCAGVDVGALRLPVWAQPNRVPTNGETALYEHENVDGQRTGMTVFLESGPIPLSPNGQVMTVNGIMPDVADLTAVNFRCRASFSPTGTETDSGPLSLSSSPGMRLTGRFIRLRIEPAGNTDWRLGTMRLDLRPRGWR